MRMLLKCAKNVAIAYLYKTDVPSKCSYTYRNDDQNVMLNDKWRYISM